MMKISVIIPAFNAAAYIGIAIDSALMQKQIGEVIVVDDGSTDDTFTIASKLGSKNKLVKVYTHPNRVHKGISGSRNLGISKVKSPFFSWLDADDYYLQNRFDAAEKILLDHSEIDGVYGKMQNFALSKEGVTIIKTIVDLNANIKPEDLFLYLFKETNHYFSHCSLVLRSAKATTFKYDQSLKIGEDTDYLYRLCHSLFLKSDGEITPHIFRRIHGNNISLSVNIIEHNKVRLEIAKKWLMKLKVVTFEPTVKKVILLRYLSQKYLVSNFNELSPFRYLIKGYFLMVLLIKERWLISVLLKNRE